MRSFHPCVPVEQALGLGTRGVAGSNNSSWEVAWRVNEGRDSSEPRGHVAAIVGVSERSVASASVGEKDLGDGLGKTWWLSDHNTLSLLTCAEVRCGKNLIINKVKV